MSQKEKPSSESLVKSRKSPSVSSWEDDVPVVWQTGDVILDLYEVKDVYWPGAKGLVYRVHHREWNVDLAVKSPGETPLETKEQIESFVAAADAWVGLGLFPHIVSCYYVRKLGGIPRLFLEFIEGGSLHDWIHTRRLYEGGAAESLKRILDIAIQFAWGLQHAHEQQLIHGDVRPSNLLLTVDGVAKVKGFGLTGANSIDAAGRAEVMSSAFSAPERAGQELSHHMDIWSWAASVLEMFTGELSWRAGELSDVALESYLERDTQNHDRPRMPAAVAALLKQCLQSDRAARPRDLVEVAERLRGIYQSETDSAYPRQRPVQATTRAEELNNRALSLLDLGRTDEALWLWDEALVLRPQHLEATYNSGLVRWRLGRITDDALVRMLEELSNSEANPESINYLLSRVHLERDDPKAATEALGKDEGAYSEPNDVSEALTQRNKGLQSERPLTAFLDDEICGPNLFSPDGESLLLTVSGFKVRILDFDRPLSPRYLRGHTQQINAITISPDGRFALTSSEDDTVRLWDLQEGECLQTIKDENWPHPNLLALSPGGQYGVLRIDPYLSERATLQLWDVKAGRWIRNFETIVSEYGERQFVCAVTFSPDGKYILTGSHILPVQLWEVATGKVVRNLEGLLGYVRSVKFSPDGTRCIAANNRQVREFDVNTGECLRLVTIEEADYDRISQIALSTDGSYALYGSEHGELTLWEISSGRCVRTFQDLTARPRYEVGRYEGIASIHLNVNGRYSLSGTNGGSFTLWRFNPEYHAPMILSRVVATEEALTNQDAAEENLALSRLAIAENRFVDAANFIRTARAVPGYERSAEAVQLWTSLYLHLPRTKVKGSWQSHTIRGQELARSISFDADGKYVLFGGFEMQLKEIATDKCLRVFDKAMNGKAALSGDARLAMIGGWEDYELWDTVSGKLINKIYSCHEKHVKDIQVSVDGRYAASCTEEVFNPWEITPEGLSHLRSTRTDWGELSAVAISSDNKYCVGGTGFSSMRDNDYTLRLWDLPSGQLLRTFKGYDSGTYALVFSPDNKYFLGAGFDHKLRLWEVATGECVRLFEGHTQSVYSVDISSDGKYALSGSPDQTLRLWDVATGECLRTWEIKTDYIGPVRFTSDCKYILAGLGGSILRIEMLDWELEDREPSDWDEGARPYLETFLVLRAATSTKGIPAWSNEDFERLIYRLGCAGFGWLRPEGVRRELEKRVAELCPQRTPAKERFAETVAGQGLLRAERSSPSTTANPALESVPLETTSWTKLYSEAPHKSVKSVHQHDGLRVSAIWTDPARFDSTPDQPVVFSRNQELVASCFHRTLRLWDSRTGESLRDLGASINRLECASFSHDGRLIAAGAIKESIKVWEVANGGCVATFPTEDSRQEIICFKQNGKLLSSGAWDGTVKVWSIKANKVLRVFKGHEDTITTIDFSPDGKLLASGSWDRTVRLWNLETGDCLKILAGHNAAVGAISFSPDGKLIATCSRDKYNHQDKLITLWDTKTGEVLRSLEGHDGSVLSFAFSPNQPLLASSAEDGSVRLWDVRTAECLWVMDTTSGNADTSSAGFAQQARFAPDGENILFCRGQRTWVERIVWSLDWEPTGDVSD